MPCRTVVEDGVEDGIDPVAGTLLPVRMKVASTGSRGSETQKKIDGLKVCRDKSGTGTPHKIDWKLDDARKGVGDRKRPTKENKRKVDGAREKTPQKCTGKTDAVEKGRAGIGDAPKIHRKQTRRRSKEVGDKRSPNTHT